MSYDVYRYIFYGCVGLAGVCLVLAVIFFFVLDIPGVIGNLTGSTARKAIEDIRNQSVGESLTDNRKGGKKGKKGTNNIPVRNATTALGNTMETSKISTGKLESEAYSSFATSVLNPQNGTTLLNQEEDVGATSILTSNDDAGMTSILTSDELYDGSAQDSDDGFFGFTIEYEIIFIHSNEVIS